MAAQGHTHLIVAGEAKIIPLVTGLLPGRLRSKLVDTVSAGAGTSTEELVAATLASFVQQEEQESQLYVDRLQQYVMKDGLGAVGVQASLETLQRRQVDVLVLSKAYDLGHGWRCEGCSEIFFKSDRPHGCLDCGDRRFCEVDLRAELVHRAEITGARVEVVEQSDTLTRLGGVGCLLRFRGSQVRRSFVYSEAGWKQSGSLL